MKDNNEINSQPKIPTPDKNEADSPSSIEDESHTETTEVVHGKEQRKSKLTERKVYLPGQKLKDGEVLEPDESAYVMLHEAQAGIPCLSFDVIPDDLGACRETFPHTCYLIAGTQAAKRNQNSIILMKFSNLRKTQKEKGDNEDSDSSSSSEDEVDSSKLSVRTPRMNSSSIPHFGCVNRLRTCQFGNTIVAAAWSELGRVTLWDLKKHLNVLENPTTVKIRSDKKKNKKKIILPDNNNEKPLYTFSGHLQEGFAMDWSPTATGLLATGDCSGNIHVWSPENSTWHVDLRPLKSHTKSVEDLQWSPNERNVLTSCSVDKTIKIWDIRTTPSKACMITVDEAHTSDVNVISWNKMEPLIVSGGDDGYLKVWDLRNFKNGTAVATFKHHTEPVTSVEWHPSDSSVFVSSGEDNQVAIWDLAVERDNEFNDQEIDGIPPQLLFIHLGQQNIKEVHWHPQIPGTLVSTAETGFNIFKTISV